MCPDFLLVFADVPAVQELKQVMNFLKKYWIATYLRKEIQLPCHPAEMAILASNHGYLERLHCAEETLSQFALV